MKAKTRTMIGSAALGIVMMFGSADIAPLAAQDTPDPVAEEDGGGFDDWGWLGLLGLAGLAGLKKREPQPVDHTVNRRP